MLFYEIKEEFGSKLEPKKEYIFLFHEIKEVGAGIETQIKTSASQWIMKIHDSRSERPQF